MGKADFEEKLKSALALSIPYGERLHPAPRSSAAVLVLWGWEGGEPQLLVTRRTETVETHKGQMAFPGGMRDETDEDPIATALRETEEEVGIPRELVRVLGPLPELATITGFEIVPVLGVLQPEPGCVPLKINTQEIAETLWVPLSTLRAPETYSRERMQVGAATFIIHNYQIGPHRIWGATGAMIKNVLDRLAALG